MSATETIAGRRDAEREYPPRTGTEDYLDGYCYRVVEIHEKIHRDRLNEDLRNDRIYANTKAS